MDVDLDWITNGDYSATPYGKEVRRRIEEYLSTSPARTKKQVLAMVHAAWDPLPIPPADELVDPWALEVKDPESLDLYNRFAGRRWDKVRKRWASLLPYTWLLAHHAYYWASEALLLLESEPDMVSNRANGVIVPLHTSLIDSMSAKQRLAAIAVIEYVMRESPEFTRSHSTFGVGYFESYFWLKRWEAKQGGQ